MCLPSCQPSCASALVHRSASTAPGKALGQHRPVEVCNNLAVLLLRHSMGPFQGNSKLPRATLLLHAGTAAPPSWQAQMHDCQTGAVSGLAVSFDGRHCISGSKDGSLLVQVGPSLLLMLWHCARQLQCAQRAFCCSDHCRLDVHLPRSPRRAASWASWSGRAASSAAALPQRPIASDNCAANRHQHHIRSILTAKDWHQG